MAELGRTKYRFANLGIALVCLLLIALVWIATMDRIGFERGQEVEAAENRNATLAIVLEEQTIRTLKGTDQVLRFVRHEYERTGVRPDVQKLVDEGALDDSLFGQIVITDERGTVGAQGDSAARRDYFQALRAYTTDDLFIGKSAFDPVTGKGAIPIGRRMNKPDGSFAGVVSATVNPVYFTRIYQQANLGEHGMVAMVGLDGLVRARQVGSQSTFGEDMRGSPLLAEHAKAREGNFVSDARMDDVPRFYSYRTLREFPLIVSVGTSVAETLRAFEDHRRIYLGGAAFATAFILILGAGAAAALARQRRVLESFERSDARFRATFDQAFVGMMQVAIDGRPLQVNKTICTMLGYSEEELLARSVRDLIHPEDRPAGGDFAAGGGLEDSLPAGDDGSNPGGIEKRLVRKDGVIVWANTATTLVRDAHGKPDFFVNVILDITEFKRVDRMKNEFVSTVSHELRTPLTSIRGSLGVIAGGIGGQLPEAVKKLVDIAKNNCERLIRLINDILDTEKIASGKMRFDLKVLALKPLIAETLQANEGFAKQSNVTLKLHAPDDPLRVNIDSDRLNQVVTNLISNAVKFSPPGGAVEVGITRVLGERVRVEIRDHGPGIPEEFQSRIFQKFSQADSSDQRQKGGTGLGLNISMAIIERMGGTIGFSTAPGEGATFHFELPEWKDQVATLPPARPRRTERPCVLVCEDDPDIARLIEMMLDKAGYDADLAFTAAAGKALATSRPYAVMTVDIRLPDGDGITLVRALRHEERSRHLPIVIVSAVADRDRVQFDSEALTISDWLGKPIDENRLILAVRHAIEGAEKERPRILHVEDDLDIQRIIAAIGGDFATFEFAATLEEARARLLIWKFDIVLLDLHLPDGSGWKLVAEVEAQDPPPAIVVFSASDVTAAESARVAAVLIKSETSNEELLATLRRVLESRTMPAPAQSAEQEPGR
jgi:PAS domain S-box-containing protein